MSDWKSKLNLERSAFVNSWQKRKNTQTLRKHNLFLGPLPLDSFLTKKNIKTTVANLEMRKGGGRLERKKGEVEAGNR